MPCDPNVRCVPLPIIPVGLDVQGRDPVLPHSSSRWSRRLALRQRLVASATRSRRRGWWASSGRRAG